MPRVYTPVYTPEELEKLLAEFNRSTPLSELEVRLNRSASGIAQKMESLSKQYPDAWDPEKASEYRRESYRQYYRRYREQHRDKRRLYNRQYREQHRDKRRLYNRQYREQHREECRRYNRQYREQHRDKIREKDRRYSEQHREEHRQYTRLYIERNKGRWLEFGDYLAQLLNEFNGNKKQAAAELGIHPSLLSHYLAGNRKPNEKFLMGASEIFDVPYETLCALIK